MNLLRYMEDSTEENAVTEGLKELHRMETEVKRDGEAGVAYMKSFVLGLSELMTKAVRAVTFAAGGAFLWKSAR